MRLLHGAFLVSFSIVTSWALQQSEAGVVDWHKKLVGVPLSGSLSTAPVFHTFTEGSFILTATENNVLAALNARDGSVAWRHIFEPQDKLVRFHQHKNVVASLSGPGSATLRSFEALTGQLLVEKRLYRPDLGPVSDPSDFGTDIAFIYDSSSEQRKHPDIFVLTGGHTVQRIGGLRGATKWSWTSSDQSSATIFSNIIATSSTIYLVGLTKSTASYTLQVTALSATTGVELSSANIPSSITHGLSDLITLRDIDTSSGTPAVAWLQQGTLTYFPLAPELKGKPMSVKGSKYKEIVDVGLRDKGQFVAVKSDGSSCAMLWNAEGSNFTVFWDFANAAPSRENPDSLYAGGFNHNGRPFIARLHWSHGAKGVIVDVLSTPLSGEKGDIINFAFPYETEVHGIAKHFAIEAATPGPSPSVVVTTATGAVQLWEQGAVQWIREESLATISVAELVELPEKKVISSHVGEGQETVLGRLIRQLSDARGFPQYIVNFAKRFATGSYASVSSSAAPSSDTDALWRDAFGFRKIIVAATPFGTVFGIDSSNGNIIWSRVFGLGWAAEVGGRILPVKLFVTRTVNDGDTPQVVIVTQRIADNSLIDTVVFHLDALTGEDARKVSPSGAVLQGLDIISGPLLDAYLFQDEKKIVVLFDEYLQAHIYPDTPHHRSTFMKALPLLHFPLRAGPHRVMGHQIAFVPELGDKVVGYPTWSFSSSPDERIQTMFPPVKGPVASVGKVLGNHTTLYKYLNPRLFVILTESPLVSPKTCGVYLVDSTKGSIIYHANVPASAEACNVKASLTENWLVYHYYEDFAGVGQAKGYRVVSVELYEGTQIDDKTSSSDMSSFSDASVQVTAIEQSYIFPHGITAITTTSTKFGITAKDIIVANQNHQIQAYSRRLLDPRRPDHKPTAAEQEEYLIQYDPLLPDDPHRVLSHNYEVANIRHILTSPALLESTSLVFAYGLDLFLTRVAPSNTFDVLSEDFNKVQLVLTVSGLALAILITKPMVARKRLRERWYQ